MNQHVTELTVEPGWAQEEYAATLYLVRVVQFVDGARQVDADAGMSAPENRGHP